MTKTTNISRTRHPSFPQEQTAAIGGWRVKERKTAGPARIARRNTIPQPIGPKGLTVQTVTAPLSKSRSQREGWLSSRRGLAGTGAALIILLTMAAASSLWLKSPNALQTTEAETQTSSSTLSDQKTAAEPATSDEGYRLYLGTYRSELAARLTWAGLQADSATMLVGLDPFFKPSEEGESAFYHVLAGRHATYHEANSHCSWLRDHGVDCSIVDG